MESLQEALDKIEIKDRAIKIGMRNLFRGITSWRHQIKRRIQETGTQNQLERKLSHAAKVQSSVDLYFWILISLVELFENFPQLNGYI